MIIKAKTEIKLMINMVNRILLLVINPKLQTSVIHRIQLFLIKAKIVTAVMLQLVPSPLYMEPLLQEALVVHCLED